MAERFAAHLKDLRGPSVEKRCFRQLVDKVLVSGTVNDFSAKTDTRMNACDEKSNCCREDG